MYDSTEPDDEFDLMYDQLIESAPRGFYIKPSRQNYLTEPFHYARLKLLLFFNHRSYSHFLHRYHYPRGLKKACDGAFIYHYINDHLYGNTKVSILERVRFSYMWLTGWRREWCDKIVLSSKRYRTKKEKEFLQLYDELIIFTYLEIKNEDHIGEKFHDPSSVYLHPGDWMFPFNLNWRIQKAKKGKITPEMKMSLVKNTYWGICMGLGIALSLLLLSYPPANGGSEEAYAWTILLMGFAYAGATYYLYRVIFVWAPAACRFMGEWFAFIKSMVEH